MDTTSSFAAENSSSVQYEINPANTAWVAVILQNKLFNHLLMKYDLLNNQLTIGINMPCFHYVPWTRLFLWRHYSQKKFAYNSSFHFTRPGCCLHTSNTKAL